MRAKEFIVEYSTEPKEGPLEDFDGLEFKITVHGFYNQINVSAFIPKSKKEIGRVLFDILDYRQLEPLDLYVDEKYRGRGIAKTMYDYVKSKGYAIHRSWDQTEAGAKFWNKNRGEDGQLWESDLTVGRNLSPATEKYIKNHKWKLTTVDPMTLDIDSFDDPFNRVIDIDTEHSVNFSDPIIVHSNGTTIIDGFHRVYQAQQQGLKKLPAYVPVEQNVTEDVYGVKRNVTQFLDSLTPDDVGVDIVGPYRIHYEGFNDDCKSSIDYRRNPDKVYQQVFADHIKREKGQQPLEQNMVGNEEYPILYSIFSAKSLKEGDEINELFQPGKKNWKWKFRGSEEAMAQFTVGDRDYMWNAYNHFLDDRPDKWEIQFRLLRKDIDPESLDLFGTTGTGNSTEVMSTVIDITREFLQQYISGINEITFNAKENSRIALYRKMIKRLLPNWELEEDYTTHDGLKFTLYKPKEM